MSFFQLIKTQKIPSTLNQVWDFISLPINLKEITPKYMGFEIVNDIENKRIYPGMIIIYKVSPILNFKVNWVTEITHIKENEYFVDEQRIGPYKLWHHQHIIEEIDGGVLMTDIVTYQPPFGFLGSIANALFIKKKLENIFSYRTKIIEDKFGKFAQ